MADGDEFDGKVTHVDDKHNITAAYLFGGLRLPLGESVTVAKGDKLVGALGPVAFERLREICTRIESAERFGGRSRDCDASRA